jgi:hypothetical protein
MLIWLDFMQVGNQSIKYIFKMNSFVYTGNLYIIFFLLLTFPDCIVYF